MPGKSRPSGFDASTTTVYVTTFWTVVEARRTCETVPSKLLSEYASTLKRAGWPLWILPMSASGTLTWTCTLVRSCAIRNSVGACRLAATVWPTSTARATAASSEVTCAASRRESSGAMVWPALTCELKSAKSFSIAPLICVPTCTSTTGCTVPLAATPSISSPRSTLPVRYCTPGTLPEPVRSAKYQYPAPASARTIKSTRTFFILGSLRGHESQRPGEQCARRALVGARLHQVAARQRQGLLRVGELDRGALANIEAALGQLEVLFGALDRERGQVEALARILHAQPGRAQHQPDLLLDQRALRARRAQ